MPEEDFTEETEDSFTEETSESWFSRIAGAIKGIVFGLVFFIVAFPLLFWNEGRSVKRYKTLKEGSGSVISVSPDRVEPGNDGKLVHVAAQAVTDEVLSDKTFGISANALKLKRTVEMYQWEEDVSSEKKKNVGGGTTTTKTYSYSKGWNDELVDSSGFKKPSGHENPGSMPYSSQEIVANKVTIGAFTLSRSLLGKISNFTPLDVGSESGMPDILKDKGKLHDGGFFIGDNPAEPRIGNIRIFFKAAMPTEVSLVSKQSGNTFETYHAKTGGTIELLQTGIHSADSMFKKAEEANKFLTWILRFVGFIVMMIGINLFLRPLSVLADVLPILGDIVEAGTGIISFLLALVLSFVTIAIAWIVYRPIIGIGLLAAAVAAVIATGGKLKKARAA